jgi:hypothetical protein
MISISIVSMANEFLDLCISKPLQIFVSEERTKIVIRLAYYSDKLRTLNWVEFFRVKFIYS